MGWITPCDVANTAAAGVVWLGAKIRRQHTTTIYAILMPTRATAPPQAAPKPMERTSLHIEECTSEAVQTI